MNILVLLLLVRSANMISNDKYFICICIFSPVICNALFIANIKSVSDIWWLDAS